jgi:histidinol-phosphate/aromatic aminotransferase/cobyric acid decarboxylase-like protein
LWAFRPHELYDQPYLGAQDDLHETTTLQWRAWVAPVLEIPDAFGFRYATQGSTEAIRESLALHAISARAAGRQPVIHVFHGEYEGYAAEMESYGGRVVRHDRDEYEDSFAREASAGDRVYLSQPSAIDGNVWTEFPALVAFIEERLPALELMVDLTYVGTVGAPYRIDVRSPVVHTVFFSLSKVFGVYYHRIGGALSREPLTGLYGNRWFKNTFSLELGRRLLESLEVRAVPKRYASLQAEAVASVAARLGVPLVASDVVLLAHHPWTEGLPDVVAPLRRGSSVRYCLTPALDHLLGTSRDDAEGFAVRSTLG